MTNEEKQKLIGQYVSHNKEKLKIISYSIEDEGSNTVICEKSMGWINHRIDPDVFNCENLIGVRCWYVILGENAFLVKRSIHEKLKDFKI
jgi:hypothetical protein